MVSLGLVQNRSFPFCIGLKEPWQIINERKEYHEKTGGKYIGIFPSGNGTTSDATYDTPLKKKRLAMLDLLIAVQKANREKIDDRGIREEVDTFIFEGHDTTVMGLNFAVALLAEHKQIQARARVEIDDVMKESDGKFGMAELQNLPYLDRCIKEALRLYPPVPSISRKITDDMQLKKYVVPRGCIVTLHIYDVHRDPNFWPEPDVFDPDRFLPDRIKNRHPFSYIPFSAGSRNCIGQRKQLIKRSNSPANNLNHAISQQQGITNQTMAKIQNTALRTTANKSTDSPPSKEPNKQRIHLSKRMSRSH